MIEAAIRVYGEIGYANASVKKVCQAANLTERYFYESFPNSEDLLVAAFTEITERLYAAVESAQTAPGGGADAIEIKLAAYFDALHAHPASTRVFLIEIPGINSRIDVLFGEAMNRFGRMLYQQLAVGAPLDEDRLLLRGVTGGLLHIAREWVAGGYAVPTPEVVHAARRLCMAMVPAST